jgi:hypothetical protein
MNIVASVGAEHTGVLMWFAFSAKNSLRSVNLLTPFLHLIQINHQPDATVFSLLS